MKIALENERYSAPVLIVMGVSGSGKSTIGALLAKRLDYAFKEGDDLHSHANVKKMNSGVALADKDRWPWLEEIRNWVYQQSMNESPSVISCSALKKSYREILRAKQKNITVIYLKVAESDLMQRLTDREGHFMPANLLQSQLETLEEPVEEFGTIVQDGNLPPDLVVEQIIGRLRTMPSSVT